MTTDILLSQRFVPEFGGSIRWMYEVYRRWPSKVRVITHDYDDAQHGPEMVTDPQLEMDRRDIFMSDWGMESIDRIKRYWRMTRAVGEVLRKTQGVVRVHCTHAVPEVVSLLPLHWRFGRRLRVICYAHGEEITACCSSRQLKFLMRRAHGIIDRMIANSRYTASLLETHIDAQKITVIHPGVDLNEFTGAVEAGGQWRQEHQWQDRLIVLTVGRLDPRKNHAAMIDAVAELASQHPQLLYVIASDGREMDRLKNQARQRGIGDRVIFAGAVDNATKIAMYGGCDLFAMPAVQDGTDVEGFGMVFLEAAACGKPSICGNTGGQADAVINGKTGLMVNGRDGEQVAGTLQKLVTDNQLRHEMGIAAQAHARQFDWPVVVQQTAQLVEKIK